MDIKYQSYFRRFEGYSGPSLWNLIRNKEEIKVEGTNKDKIKEEFIEAQEDPTQVFIRMLVILFSSVANIDDSLSVKEMEYVRRYFNSRFSGKEAREWIQIFEQSMFQYIDYKPVCERIKGMMTYEMRLQLLQMLYDLANADGEIAELEDKVIRDIAGRMGLKDNDISSLRALYFEDEDSPYKVLGLKRGASQEEIRQAFHALAVKYHPDKVAHLGEDFVKVANEKFKAIKNAYDTVRLE
jgi:DnaJ like chaperone protein